MPQQRFAPERLQGKALEDAFKVLTRRRPVVKTMIRMRSDSGKWVSVKTVKAKTVCRQMHQVAKIIRDQLKGSDIILQQADTCVRVQGLGQRSIDLQFKRGQTKIICELKMSETPYRAIKSARNMSEGWLHKAAFGRSRAAHRIGFLGVTSDASGVRWRLELQDKDGNVENIIPQRSFASGCARRKESVHLKRKEKAHRKVHRKKEAYSPKNILYCKTYRRRNALL